MMHQQKYLIVNADDFGQCAGINRGIIRAYEEGILTSASLMVRWDEAQAAVEYAQHNPGLSLGLHIDLGEWACRNGEWISVYEVIPTGDDYMLSQEIHSQLEQFRDLTGRNPTHLDSHQHVHRRGAAHSLLKELAQEMDVPLRMFGPVRYCGGLYGQTVEGITCPEILTFQNLAQLISSCPPGVTELCTHPAEDTKGLRTTYRDERKRELQLLCDPRAREALHASGVRLCSFEDAPWTRLQTPRHALN